MVDGSEGGRPEPPASSEAGRDEPGFEIGSYINILLRRVWWFVGAVAVCGIGAMIHIAVTEPIYSPVAKVMVPTTMTRPIRLDPSADGVASVLPSPVDALQGSSASTEMQVMRSWVLRYMAAEILRSYGGLVREITEGKRVVLGAADLVTMDRGTESLGDEQKSPETTDRAEMEALGRQLAEVKTNPMAYEAFRRESPPVAQALSSIDVAIARETSVLQVRAESTDPMIAGDVANAVCLAYLISKLQDTRLAASSGLSYLDRVIDGEKSGGRAGDVASAGKDKEQKGAELTLDEAEDNLAEFRARTGIVGAPDQADHVVEELRRLRQQMLDLQMRRRSQQAKLARLRLQIEQTPETRITSSQTAEPPLAKRLQDELGALYRKRLELVATYQPSAPEIEAIDQQIEDLRERIAEAGTEAISTKTETVNPIYETLLEAVNSAEAELSATEAEIGPMQAALSRTEAEVAGAPTDEVQLARRQREADLARQRYLSLRQKQEEYRLAKESQLSNVRIIAPARASRFLTPVRPRPRRELAMGLFLGAVVGLALVILAELIDDTYPDLHSIERDLRLPLLGLIPRLKIPNATSVLIHDPPPSLKEALRGLRTNVQFAAADSPVTSLLVTSSMPGEGKTTISTGLALAAAEAGQKVILIDADLRRPTVAKLLGLAATPGLSNILVGQVEFATCLQTYEGGEGGAPIDVLVAGPLPPNPPALLESDAMARLLEEAVARADLVVLDAPPIGHFSDAQILGAKVSGVLVVVDPTTARRGVVRGAKRLLDMAETRMVGLLCNKVQRPGMGGYYYYYGSRYYYHYDYDRYYHSYDDDGETSDEENPGGPRV